MFFFYFDIGVKILFALTILFYIFFLVSIYSWSETKTTFLVVPFIYTFQFFIIGFLMVVVFAIGLDFLVNL